MPARCVVCWDGSPTAATAGAWALRRWELAREPIEVIDVLDRDLFLGDPAAEERATVQEEVRLTRWIDAVEEEHPGAVVSSALLVGDPLRILAAQTRPQSLVVVGTRGRVGPRGRYGWSLGARLAATADGPVAIVPPEDGPGAHRRSGIVVGVDGSDIGRRALAFAAREAERAGELLTVVHCWQEPLVDEPLIVPDDEFVDTQQTAHQELLDDHVRAILDEHPGLPVDPVLLRSGAIAGLRGRAMEASLLVVGTRRLSGWKRAWLGSVSHGLVLDIVAPMIVVGRETAAEQGMTAV